MSKHPLNSPSLIVIAIGVAIQLIFGWNKFSIGTIIVAAGLILAVANVFKIGLSGDSGHRSHIIIGGVVLGILMLFGVTVASVGVQAPTVPTNSLSLTNQYQNQQIPVTGQTQSAILKLNVKNNTDGTVMGSGNTIFALPAGVISNRNDLMKHIYDGNTAMLTPNTMSLTAGTFSYNGFIGRVGDTVTFAGYQDGTPAAAENMSFVKTVTLTGITGGSTPEWMTSDSQYVWYNYPTLAFYNDTDSASTFYKDQQTSAIERTLTFTMFPSQNGQGWSDASLYIEAPSSNAGAFVRVEITTPEGQTSTYTALQSVGQMSSNDPRFTSAPSLTTTTDTMYYVGAIPTSAVRTSTTQKARVTFKVTYNHPASGNVNTYFKVVSNSNALTISGGHFDSPATNLNLNMTADPIAIGANQWGNT